MDAVGIRSVLGDRAVLYGRHGEVARHHGLPRPRRGQVSRLR